jgi:hypothetical protein
MKIDGSPNRDTDFVINKTMYDITLLETRQYQQEFRSVLDDILPAAYRVDDIQLFSLDLPHDVPRKLYFENPQRVFQLGSGY